MTAFKTLLSMQSFRNLKIWADLQYLFGSRPCDLSSSLISSCSYLQTSAERMKGERDHLNQQQLITEQIHIFLILCAIQSLQTTNFPHRQIAERTDSKTVKGQCKTFTLFMIYLYIYDNML